MPGVQPARVLRRRANGEDSRARGSSAAVLERGTPPPLPLVPMRKCEWSCMLTTTYKPSVLRCRMQELSQHLAAIAVAETRPLHLATAWVPSCKICRDGPACRHARARARRWRATHTGHPECGKAIRTHFWMCHLRPPLPQNPDPSIGMAGTRWCACSATAPSARRPTRRSAACGAASRTPPRRRRRRELAQRLASAAPALLVFASAR